MLVKESLLILGGWSHCSSHKIESHMLANIKHIVFFVLTLVLDACKTD